MISCAARERVSEREIGRKIKTERERERAREREREKKNNTKEKETETERRQTRMWEARHISPRRQESHLQTVLVAILAVHSWSARGM